MKTTTSTFSGLTKPVMAQKKANKNDSIDSFIKALEREEIVMRKTTEALVQRLAEFHDTNAELQHEMDVSLAYNSKLPAIKSERQRLLKLAKYVP